MAPHQAEEALGAISELAIRLRPFAGEAAEVAARRLVERFGSPGRLLSASSRAILETLHDVPVLGAYILAARDLTDFAARAVIVGEPVDPQSRQMQRYLTTMIGTRPTETVLAVYLDGKNAFLASEVLAMGSEGAANFPARLLISRALEIGSHGILLAHNHPSGSAAPSEEDHAATAHIRALTSSLGIELIDHLIVARNRIYSMARGVMI